MDRIKLHDKTFRLYITADEIEEKVNGIAQRLNEDLKEVDTPLFLSVLSGSFIFAADLMRKINVQSDIAFIKLASYEGTESTGNVKQVMGLSKSVEGKTVVIIEDIVDTGNTIAELYRILKNAGAADIKICALMFKPGSYNKDIKIDYPVFSIPNDFIIGYGLDYNQLGRQYKDIYVIDE